LQLLLRFLIGGVCVCLFAVLGDSFKPKSFAGLFGAAPSIALAGFGLVWFEKGSHVASVEGRSMIFGAVAMIIYSLSCAAFVRRTHVRPWLAAGVLWIEWLVVAFAIFAAVPK
jgi:uncharacterized membrane protein (GlpM family)